MHPTDRIPGFAVCARCGIRRQLAACKSCGLLVCVECRGQRECAVCHFERVEAARRQERRTRLRELGRRAAVVTLVAASGATGLGAAFLPDGPLCARVIDEPAPMQLRLAPATAAPAGEPMSLEATQPPPWTEPLSFRCYTARGVACCTLDPP